MKITTKTTKLICDIEYIIGGYCYNDNSNYGEGGYIRYPVWTCFDSKREDEKTGKIEKTEKWEKVSFFNLKRIKPVLSAKEVKSLEYRFGANELVIGRAIIDVLEFLEDRYDIDFAELEKNLEKEEFQNEETPLLRKNLFQ